jgi:hypothetical protein
MMSLQITWDRADKSTFETNRITGAGAKTMLILINQPNPPLILQEPGVTTSSHDS